MIKDWKLMSFDLFTLGMTIKGAWIYCRPLDEDMLRKSLDRVGEMYPHLSGRYCEKCKSLVYDVAEPLPLAVADLRNYATQDLMKDAKKAWSLVTPYDLNAFKSGKIGPFSATMGRLKDGCIFYVQCAHSVMDGATFYSLMRQWAALYRGEEIHPMVVDQMLLPSPTALSKEETLRQVQQQGWMKIGLGKVVKMVWNLARNNAIKETYVVEVSQEELQQMKHASGAGTHAVLSAIAMKRFAEHLPGCKQQKMIQTVDLRGRLKGVDDRFFGNCSQAFPLKGSFDVEMDVASLAKAIDLQCHIDNDEVDSLARLSVCASNYSLPYFFFDASDMNNMHPGTIYINNQLKLRACELDWGEGVPCYVFANDLTDMVKLWQPVAGGPVQIIYGGMAAKIMKR